MSGAYYNVSVLPQWLQGASVISPATYIPDGVRGAIIHGQSLAELQATLLCYSGSPS